MFQFRKSVDFPSKTEALAGRPEPIATSSYHFVNGEALKGPYPQGYEVALFGLGCFWGAEKLFWQLPGVYVTAVGYAGGPTPNPTYREVCSGMTGHTEAVLVVYDPRAISYQELLRAFWEGHDPTRACVRAMTSARNIALASTSIPRSSVRRRKPQRRPIRQL